MRKLLRNKGLRLIAALTVLVITIIVCSAYAFAAQETYSRYTGQTYTHDSALDNYIIVDGIDVSGFQGDINWKKVKSDGIDFAIIRAGGRFYQSGGLYSDDKFVSNMKGAKANGIMVGVYFFSQATTSKEAKKEVDYTIKLIEDAGYTAADLDLPVFMDYELAPDCRIGDLTKAKRTSIAKAWMNYVSDKGYTPGIYTDLYFGQEQVNGSAISKNYDYWAAQYFTKNQFAFEYCWWQYASNGKVYGINSNNTTDMNYWYINSTPMSSVGEDDPSQREGSGFSESEEAIEGTVKYSLANASVTVSGADDLEYDGTPHKPAVTVRYNGEKLVKDTDYKLKYIRNVQAGTAYAVVIGMGKYADYNLAPFKIYRFTDISGFTFPDIPDQVYTGKKIFPAVTIKDKNGKVLVRGAGADYVLNNTDNIDCGKGKITVTFKGSYKGTKVLTYNIVKASQTINVKNDRKVRYKEDGAYDLKVSTKFPAKITYSSSNKAVAKVDKNGKVTPLKKGTTVITIRSSSTPNVKAGTKKITLEVRKRGLTQSQMRLRDAVQAMDYSLWSKKTSRGIVITWKKNGTKKVDKVEIFRSTKKYKDYKRYYTKLGNRTQFTNVNGLRSGTRYYYKVRGYRVINYKRYYTKWSNIVSRKWS